MIVINLQTKERHIKAPTLSWKLFNDSMIALSAKSSLILPSSRAFVAKVAAQTLNNIFKIKLFLFQQNILFLWALALENCYVVDAAKRAAWANRTYISVKGAVWIRES